MSLAEELLADLEEGGEEELDTVEDGAAEDVADVEDATAMETDADIDQKSVRGVAKLLDSDQVS